MNQKQVGQLNGIWSVGFKFALVTTPVVLAALTGFASWITVEHFNLAKIVHANKERSVISQEAIVRYSDIAVPRSEYRQLIDRLDRVEAKLDKVIENK